MFVFQGKDSYGNEVSRLARPLPVEYLLVDVPASTPLQPRYTFRAHSMPNVSPFPVENRLVDGQVQEFNTFCTYMQQFTREQFFEAVSDFHLLIYIAFMDMLPLKDFMGPLLEAVRTNDKDKALEWACTNEWGTVEQLISATSSSSPTTRNAMFEDYSTGAAGAAASGVGSAGVLPGAGDDSRAEQSLWTCSHCTFLNPSEKSSCEMCSLPR